MMKGFYLDVYSDFECLVLACSVNSNNMLIQDIETGEKGWCSPDFIELNDI